MQVAGMRLLVTILFSLAPVSSAARIQVDDYRGFCGCIILTSLNKTANAFYAQQLLEGISDTISTSELETCNGWTADPDYEISIFADRFGKPTSNISASAGAFAPDINEFCGPPEFGEKLSFPDFSASTAGLLLPWIAIFAQLPRQTGSNYSDILSIFISIGSPSWILSSVFLAVLFRRAVNTRFDRLNAKFAVGQSGSVFLQLAERCKAAKIIVQAFIQAPVRLNRRPGVFSSLVTFPVNHWWWLAAAEKIEGWWRRIDAVFIVQTFIAVLAWILAIIADFWSLPGAASANSSEWQICMGTLWLWVFAATFGPVAIKSLYKAKAMHKALYSPSSAHDKVHVPLDGGDIVKQHSQTAIVQRSGLVPQWLPNRRPSLQEYEIKNEDGKAEKNVRIPEMWGFSIEGDGESEGLNTFPYRFFSSCQIGDQVFRGFESLQDRLKENQVPDTDQDESAIFQTNESFDSSRTSDFKWPNHNDGVALNAVGDIGFVKAWDSNKPPQRNLAGSARAMDRYLRIDFERFDAYPEWNKISHDQWIPFIIANFFGLAVQWATSGPAIYVMYYSPPVGLGCDSGGLLIYAIGATLSWLLLTMGNLLSHTALLYYQRHHREYPYQPITGHYSRTKFHTFVCGAAVITRVLGKSIAVISACWILIWSILTYTNVMETPYCTTAYFSLRKHGWMRLWDFDPKQFTSTKVEELQCLLFGSFFAYFACVLIFALTSDGKTRRARWTIITALSLGFTIFAIPLYLHGVKSVENAS